MECIKRAKLINWGVDYLRVTSRDKKDHVAFEQEFQRVLKKDRVLGYKSRSGGAFGFWGTSSRHGMLAIKEDWHLLQVSGRMAKGMEGICKVTQNCTRIDVQVTFQVGEENVATVIRYMYESACDAPHGEGHPHKVKLIEENRKAQTVYIGSRSSDNYMRIYDKYQESGEEAYKGCVRVELEIKGKTSKGVWKKMSEEGAGEGYLTKILYAYARKVGIEMPEDVGGSSVEVYKPTMMRNIEKTLAWIQKSVAPSISRLVSEYGWLLPVRILLEDVLTEDELLTVCESCAIVWGS